MTSVALVTGAARGIGHAVAAGLAARGTHVVVAARDVEQAGDAARRLQDDGLAASALTLDVTDDGSVAAAARTLERDFGRLDILVNNAGVLLDKDVAPSSLSIDVLKATFDVNVFGVVRVTNAMLPLLHRADPATIVNVSSAMGSLTLATTPSWEYAGLLQAAYNSSKAALNALTIQYAKELTGTAVAVTAVHPGVCATDLNRHTGSRTPEQGAAVIVDHATGGARAASGGFFDEDGPLPW